MPVRYDHERRVFSNDAHPAAHGFEVPSAGIPSVCGAGNRPGREKEVSENASRGQQAAEEVARRWITTMQSVADQMHRQQQTFQQMMQESMNSYVQLLQQPALLRLPAAA